MDLTCDKYGCIRSHFREKSLHQKRKVGGKTEREKLECCVRAKNDHECLQKGFGDGTVFLLKACFIFLKSKNCGLRCNFIEDRSLWEDLDRL